jgi:hypothetical protein
VTKFIEFWNFLFTLLPLESVVIVLPPEGCLFDFVLPCYPFFAIVETQIEPVKDCRCVKVVLHLTCESVCADL